MVDPEASLKAATAVDFVCREEFDYTCQEVAQGLPLQQIKGLSYRADDGTSSTTCRAPHREHGRTAFVAAHLQARPEDRDYFIGYLKHPYVSFYTAGAAARSARSACGRKPSAETATGVRSARTSSPKCSGSRRTCGSEGNHVRRRHLHRHLEPAAGGGDRGGNGPARHDWSCNAKANVPTRR